MECFTSSNVTTVVSRDSLNSADRGGMLYRECYTGNVIVQGVLGSAAVAHTRGSSRENLKS